MVRRLAQGHPAGQRVKGTLAVVWGQGPSAPSSPSSPASLRGAAHPHVHQHAHPHAGVCQWLVSIPHPGHWTRITEFDPHSHPEGGMTIIVPIIQMRSERLRNFPSKWGSQD